MTVNYKLVCGRATTLHVLMSWTRLGILLQRPDPTRIPVNQNLSSLALDVGLDFEDRSLFAVTAGNFSASGTCWTRAGSK